MPSEQITPRKVLQDLGYAPALRVPEPIQQPAPAVQKFGNQDLAQVNQLVNALGDFNSNIKNFALDVRNSTLKEQQDLIASDVNKLTEEYNQQKDKNNQTLGSFVEKGLISYGRLPEIRKQALMYMGKQKANELFQSAFTERADEVTRLENPSNPDEVASDIYKNVMSKLGDNQYVRAGADEVFANLRTNFAVNAAAAKDKRFEYQTEQNTSAEMQGLVDRYSVATDPADKQGTLESLFRVQTTLRNSGVSDYKKLFSSTLSQAVTSLAYTNPEKAQQLLSQLSDFPIKDEQGKVVGQFGRTTEERLLLTKLTQEADKAFDAKMLKHEQVFKATQNELIRNGEDVVNALMPDYTKTRKPISSPEFVQSVNSAIAQKYGTLPASTQGAIYAAAMNRIHAVQSNIPLNPELFQKIHDAAARGDASTYDTLVRLLPPEQQIHYITNREKMLSFGNISQSPAVNLSLQQLNATLRTGLKISDTDAPDLLEQKLGITLNAAEEHKRRVNELVHTLRPEFKGTDEEFVSSKEFLNGVSKITSDIQKEQMVQWNTFNNEYEAKAKEQTPESRLIGMFSQTPNVSLFRPNSKKWYEGLKGSSDTYFNSMSAVSFEVDNKINEKQLETVKMMQKNIQLAREMLPEIAGAALYRERNGVPLTVSDVRLATETYTSLKRVIGYTTKEIVRGITSEGFPVDVEKIANSGDYLYVPMFQSDASMKTEQQGLSSLMTQYVTASDKATKDKLKTEIEHNPLFKTLQKLHIDPISTSPSNAKYFFQRQAKILQHLPPKATSLVDTTDATPSYPINFY